MKPIRAALSDESEAARVFFLKTSRLMLVSPFHVQIQLVDSRQEDEQREE